MNISYVDCVIEVDKVYVTGGLKGRRRGLKKRGRERYEGDKVLVMVIVSRYGDEEYIPMSSMEGGKIEGVITSRTSRGLTIMTDEFKSYDMLEVLGYKHETITL